MRRRSVRDDDEVSSDELVEAVCDPADDLGVARLLSSPASNVWRGPRKTFGGDRCTPVPFTRGPSGTRSPGGGPGATSRMGRGLRRAHPPALNELEAKACDMAIRRRRTVRHNRGTEVIEAGNIRFGLEMRVAGG